MKTKQFHAVIAVLLLYPICSSASADALGGDYDMTFGESLGLYDFSGSYEEDVDSISMSYTIQSDANGRLTGSGTFSADEMGVEMSGSMQLAGTVKSSGSVVRMDLTFQLDGSLSYGGYNGTVLAKLKMQTELNTTMNALTGTASGSVTISVPGVGRQRESIPKMPFYMEIPESVDGEWELRLNGIQIDLKNGLAGTAQVNLGDGKTLNFNVSGKYSPKTDLSKLKLSPAAGAGAKTIKLTVSDQAGQLLVQQIKATLLGQKLSYKAAADK